MTDSQPQPRDPDCSHNLTKPATVPGYRTCQLCGQLLKEVTGK